MRAVCKKAAVCDDENISSSNLEGIGGIVGMFLVIGVFELLKFVKYPFDED